MDEKTLKDKLRELAEDILKEAFCGQCGFRFCTGELEFKDPNDVEAMLEELVLELTQE